MLVLALWSQCKRKNSSTMTRQLIKTTLTDKSVCGSGLSFKKSAPEIFLDEQELNRVALLLSLSFELGPQGSSCSKCPGRGATASGELLQHVQVAAAKQAVSQARTAEASMNCSVGCFCAAYLWCPLIVMHNKSFFSYVLQKRRHAKIAFPFFVLSCQRCSVFNAIAGEIGKVV